ncbi:hypothetical protein ACRQGJ_00320 [Actinotignum sp. GS-2025b]|uniref:hypothetical protein n=1 Tax=Actinotignum sp. GS-2025b TaxID=3427275 RepID=UPI003F4810DD
MANTIIGLINSIAEDVTRLGAIVEQAAWDGIEDHAGMPGERPITAARLESPYADEDILDTELVEDEPDEEQTTVEPEPIVELLPIEQVRAALADYARSGLNDFIKAQIRKHGHTKLSQLTVEQANAVLAAAEAEAEAGGA